MLRFTNKNLSFIIRIGFEVGFSLSIPGSNSLNFQVILPHRKYPTIGYHKLHDKSCVDV